MSKSATKSSGSSPASPASSGGGGTPTWRRLLPCLGFVLALTVLVILAYDDGYGALPPVEKRYASTRSAVDTLRKDTKRNQYRDQWLKLADEFYDIYQRDTRWVNRPAALFRSAEVLEELAGRSFAERDYKAAVARYELLAEKHAASRLADDALLRAAVIKAQKLSDTAGALRVLQQIRTQYPRGDMTSDALDLEKALRAEGKAASAAVLADKDADKEAKDAKEARDAKAAAASPRARLTQVSWTSLSRDKVQITVELNRHAPWQVRMRDADKKGATPRLVLEMDGTVPVEQVQAGARVKNSLLTRVRVNKEKESTALVFDFTAARRYDARVEQNPFRIVLTVMAGNAMPSQGVGSRLGFAECSLPEPAGVTVTEVRVASVRDAVEKSRQAAEAAEAARAEKAAEAGRAEKLSAEKARTEKARQAEAEKARATQRAAASAAADENAVQNPERNARRSRKASAAVAGNLAEQLGLTVQTVFIDAGHGGKDPGTIHNGIVERDLVLDVSRRVGRLLTANGIDVIFSRNNDVSVPLSARPQKANGGRADLFVSIHVNAHPEAGISGFETFYLDLARNAQAARVATLENAASDRKLGDMQSVLADVMLNARTEESSRLAGDIQRLAMSRLGRRGFEVKDGGTRSAPFHVLIGAGMPAVLVEVGYCTNSREAKLLGSAQYRHALAEGIAEGIMAYKNRLQIRHSAQFSLTTSARGAI